ncbi:hypothetical protein [Iningainema tapete]|uniref:Uncharacterized protein n=1 Tax=Iningainema tapete BLCC-T55 TaxID=2748662 RepID=A0A8J6XM28_9CYAN|nr:hypothetical protein [Iningainema tapete]MBD2772927.1 hypothetical protein [Iningainema tapete BLCC-T55]
MASTKKLTVAIATATLIILGLGETVQAALLGTRNFSLTGGISGIAENLQLTTRISPGKFDENAFLLPDAPTLFEGITVTPASIGKIFTATTDTDPDFNNFVAYLTDRQPDLIELETVRTASSVTRQGANGIIFGTNRENPDLFSNTVDSISIQVNSFNILGVRQLGNGDFFTDYSYDLTLNVFGQPANISEPITEPSLGLGTLVLGAFGITFLRKGQKIDPYG